MPERNVAEDHDASDHAQDRAVVRAIKAFLQRSGHPALHGIVCEFHRGLLTLRGRVPSDSVRQAAHTAAANVREVVLIDNQLEVR